MLCLQNAEEKLVCRAWNCLSVITSEERCWKSSDAASLVHDSTINNIVAWLLSLQMITTFPVIAFQKLNLRDSYFWLSEAFVDSVHAQQGLVEMNSSQKTLSSWVLRS